MTVEKLYTHYIGRLFNINESPSLNAADTFFAGMDFFDGTTSDAIMNEILGFSDLPSGSIGSSS